VRPEDDPRRPLPIRATAIFLSVWTVALVLVAFIGVPALFAVCGAVTAP